MFVGRSRESMLLKEMELSVRSEFVAVYGRRRVGKTFLIKNVFSGKLTFWITGMANASLADQLANFNIALTEQHGKLKWAAAANWMDAFQHLKTIIRKSSQRKKIVFIDELPWFDTPNSGFMSALEHFWNSWASHRKDVLLVVCGSAASWMVNTLINNKGGLHNRVTQKIRIDPFTLSECAELMRSRKIMLDRYQIIQLYMVLGGVPFYWDGVKKGESASQVINRLCFEANGLLTNEFGNLFSSLFSKSSRHESIVHALAKKAKGLSRDEIADETGLANGGGLTRLLDELAESGFIRRYRPFGRELRNSLYQLADFFSLFYLKFMKGSKHSGNDHWLKMIDSPKYRAWSGYAFEQVCLAHTHQIKWSLGISGIHTEISSWRSTKGNGGAQIDMVIDRRDGVINLFEMKFSISPILINKKYDAELRNKAGVFKRETQTRKALFFVLISPFGVKENAYSGNLQHVLTMDAMFAAM